MTLKIYVDSFFFFFHLPQSGKTFIQGPVTAVKHFATQGRNSSIGENPDSIINNSKPQSSPFFSRYLSVCVRPSWALCDDP